MERKNKVVLATNIVFLALILIADIIFMCGTVNTKIIKPIASGLFVLCGLFNLLYVNKYYNSKLIYKPLILFIGLIFAFVGDVILMFGPLFQLGAIFFAIGHIFFIIYFLLLAQMKWLDLLICAIIISGCLLLINLYEGFDFEGLDFIITLYAVIISIMVGKSVGNCINQPSLSNIILMLGAILFFTSDVMLVFAKFTSIAPKLFDTLCLATYYPGEFLLAFGLLLSGVELGKSAKKKEKLKKYLK